MTSFTPSLFDLFIDQIFADSFPVPSAQEALWGQWERQATKDGTR